MSDTLGCGKTWCLQCYGGVLSAQCVGTMPEGQQWANRVDGALPVAAEIAAAEARGWASRGGEVERLTAELTKVNDIRNSIIGCQGFNFSEHAYPLVAALDAAGMKGLPYPEARANLGTIMEQRDTAVAERDAARAEATDLRAEVVRLMAERDAARTAHKAQILHTTDALKHAANQRKEIARLAKAGDELREEALRLRAESTSDRLALGAARADVERLRKQLAETVDHAIAADTELDALKAEPARAVADAALNRAVSEEKQRRAAEKDLVLMKAKRDRLQAERDALHGALEQAAEMAENAVVSVRPGGAAVRVSKRCADAIRALALATPAESKRDGGES